MTYRRVAWQRGGVLAAVLALSSCGQEIFVYDGGSSGGGDGGPPLVGFSAPSGFAAEGVAGATWREELRVRVAWASDAPVHVDVTSSNPAALSVLDGGAVRVPAGATEAPVFVAGHAQAASVWLTARRDQRSADAGVRVLGASEVPALIALAPDAGTVATGANLPFTFQLEFPAPDPVVVTVGTTPSGFGSVPATVTVPARETEGGFEFVATSGGAGTVAVTSVNTLSADVEVRAPVISEVAAAGASSTSDEFVELYNPTDTAISLAGWKLDHRASSGTVARYHEFGPAASIPAHGFFLVGQENFDGDPDESLTKDGVPQTGRTMSANDGTILLLNNLDGGVDRLGWGSSTPEGAAASPASANASMERKAHADSTSASMTTGADQTAGNGYDSNNNQQDFVVRPARQPQKSTSPSEP